MVSEAVESSPSPCKLDHGGLEPNAIAIYEEVMYRMLPLIHSSHVFHCFSFAKRRRGTFNIEETWSQNMVIKGWLVLKTERGQASVVFCQPMVQPTIPSHPEPAAA